MLEKLRQELWQAIYLTPVWPQDLLENAKDPDYISVNFKPSDSGLEVELIFKENGEIVTSIYYFDSKDILQKAVMIEYGRKSEFYNRQDVITSLLEQILKIDNTFTVNQLTA